MLDIYCEQLRVGTITPGRLAEVLKRKDRRGEK